MTKIHDLRTFICALDEAGQLARFKSPVDLKYELTNVAVTSARQGKAAVVFDCPAGSEWPIFTGGLATPTLAALALGCHPAEIIDVMDHALDPSHAIPPRRGAEAAWKQNILTGEELDIQRLPIPTHASRDGGPFVTAGVTVSKDPVTGRGNLSYQRMQVLGRHTFGFNINEWRHVMQFYSVQESKSEPLQVAVAIGLDPAIMIAAGARYDDDELFIAGALRGEGVPVGRGVTVDIDIPAEAEIVIEGYLPPHVRHPEGLLAEFHGHYGEMWNSPTMEVTAVCFRNHPIFQTIAPGWAEHVYIGNVLPREPLLLRFVRHVSKNITGLHIPPCGNGFLAVVQIKKSNPGEPKNVALAAFTAHVNIKTVVVVDPDVNIHDPADVVWAMANRVDWSRDIFLVPGSQGHEMDPTADVRGVHTKIGIDATYKPERRDYGERVHYPEVDLTQYQSS